MRIFDTNVQKLKYDVLREVARHAYEDTLQDAYLDIPKTIAPGPEPTMRCCIYKERAIINSRLKMAMGGDKSNPAVVEVLDIACDECPVTEITVGPACRGCIATRCMHACPRDAIHIVQHRAVIDHSKCITCGKCLTACPYGAIYWNAELEIPQKCTGCAHLVDAGELPHCVDVCPHGALRFGDEEDFAEEIAAATALLPERAGADRPRVYYLNAPKRFLAGVVVDLEADEVVVGAKVTAENLATGEVLAVETDEFGDFWFRQVGKAAWRVYVEAEGYLTRVLEASTAEEDRNMGPVALYKAE